MSNDDFWVRASAWAAKRFRCDWKLGCERPVKRIHIREGEPQQAFCYAHYLEAKNHGSQCMSKVEERR